MSSLSRRNVAIWAADELAKGTSATELAKTLVAYLVSTKSLRAADLILRDIETQLLARHGHLTAEVASARELSATLRAELTRDLQTKTRAKSVEIIAEIQPELIGGLVVKTPDSVADSSIKSKLESLRPI
jgi:F-type H+-transporting ATPase subunit delta